MADSNTSQEKTEDATPKRLREARKKGQVAKSRDLNTIVILIGALGLLALMKGYIAEEIEIISRSSFDIVRSKSITMDMLYTYLQQNFIAYVRAIFPYLGGIAVIAFAASFLQIGPIFSPEPLKPQMKRINIVENVKNMAKMTTFIELIKNVAKMIIIFFIAFLVIRANLREIVLTVQNSLAQSVGVAQSVISSFLIKVFMCFIVIAVIDLFVQRRQYKKDMKMSKDEVKREYKQDEGDPLIKSMRRQLYQELVMSDVKQAVGASDFVVTNPTHVAVAVKYDEGAMIAPQIMAKGMEDMAGMIRRYAEELKVPVMQNVPLAWALVNIEVGDEVPEDLYQAVAELLIIVYRMKNNQSIS